MLRLECRLDLVLDDFKVRLRNRVQLLERVQTQIAAQAE
jgi:hypothetical protein